MIWRRNKNKPGTLKYWFLHASIATKRRFYIELKRMNLDGRTHEQPQTEAAPPEGA